MRPQNGLSGTLPRAGLLGEFDPEKHTKMHRNHPLFQSFCLSDIQHFPKVMRIRLVKNILAADPPSPVPHATVNGVEMGVCNETKQGAEAPCLKHT
jgi:hypothetical protein